MSGCYTLVSIFSPVAVCVVSQPCVITVPSIFLLSISFGVISENARCISPRQQAETVWPGITGAADARTENSYCTSDQQQACVSLPQLTATRRPSGRRHSFSI